MFLYYIEEMEWICNNRKKDLFEIFVDLMIYSIMFLGDVA